MSGKKADQGWSPYLAGALAGLLAIGSAYATTRVMGKTADLEASLTFVRAAGLIEQKVWPEQMGKKAYFQKETAKVDWQLMLVCGIFLGALTGALMGRSFEWESVPPTWVKCFGLHPLYRGVCALAGGAVAMFGARLADGSLDGYGLGGIMQLSVSGLAATGCFFLSGVVVARKIYRKGARHE